MPALADPATTPARPPRWPQAALLACAVLALHAGVLRWLTAPAPPGPRMVAPVAFQVRQVVQAAPADVTARVTAHVTGQVTARATANAAAAEAGAGVDRPAPKAAGDRPDVRRDARPGVPPNVRPDTRPDPAHPPPATAPAATSSPIAKTAAATAAELATQVPTYDTQPAPAATLVYEMQRGGRTGQAELRWRPGAGRYELDLVASSFGPHAPGSASVGSFDAAGLAPERHVDRRRGRDQRAVNFQRDGGFISFSGPQVTHALQPGAQDRLSWMLQLPAILQANPALSAPGAQVSLWVASARGESDVWTFTVQGSELLDLPGGRVDAALRLLRRPLRPFDTQVEVWLDPARQHLPVQVLLALRPGGEPTELRLQSLSLP